MLRTTRPRSCASESFVCYRCLSNFRAGPHENNRLWRLPPRFQSGKANRLKLNRSFSVHYNLHSTIIPDVSYASAESSNPPPPNTEQIRFQVIESVRQWEAENASAFVPLPDLNNRRVPGQILNTLTKGAAEGVVIEHGEEDNSDEELAAVVFGQHDMLDMGTNRQFLRAGDLVELPSKGGHHELAIFIRQLESQGQFYTISSGWVHIDAVTPLFRVPHFVEPQEFAELLPYLPVADVPREMLGKLNTMERHIPSGIGQSLLRKMHYFLDQSNNIYQANSATLDTCHARVAHLHDFRYSTLYQIAMILLPETIRKIEGSEALSPVLYAVHRALLMSDAGFILPKKWPGNAGGYYEILPRDDLANIERVRDIVREYVSSKLAQSLGTPPPERNLLYRFVKKAQQHIDFSRKSRSFTDCGAISPIFIRPDVYSDLSQVEAFDGDDRMFIKFLELWVGLKVFRLSSTLNSTGVAILRAIGRYDDASVIHLQVGWTLLQEIGILPPWASRQSFDLRLPNTGLRLSALPSEITTGFVPDKLKDIRKDWGDLPVYCIDESGAHEIDDGLSVEATDTPGEYWLHIHTADPGAHMDPSGAAAKYAEAFVGTIYMPDRVLNMLSSNYVQANLSLANNRPCLTYSAKMNTGGELLDYKITPGIVRNVLHITPRTVYEAILKSAYPLKTHSHAVGQIMTQSISRHTNQLQELSDHDKDNLTILHLIGKAITKQRTARGGYSPPGHMPRVAVSIGDIRRSSNGISTYYHGDPSIRVLTTALESSDLIALENEFLNVVSPLMLLAGEVGARWCKDRGIPVFYRLTPRNEDKADPGEFFLKHVLPKIDKRGDWDDAVAQSYFKLIGAAQSSSSPGPHMSIGVEMFARCTSPLRRYPDLVLQWQVEASILEEARLGKSLIGNTKEDFLPFSKARIDALIPYIDAKEKLTGSSNYSSTRHWFTQFLFRSWVYGQAKIPKTFSMVVKTIKPVSDEVRGLLSHFQTQVRARCEICPLTEIEIGDILEVEPDEINSYIGHTTFKVIRRLDQSEKEALDRENMLMMESQEII